MTDRSSHDLKGAVTEMARQAHERSQTGQQPQVNALHDLINDHLDVLQDRGDLKRGA